MAISKRFILTNEQRKYLGLNPIEEHWEIMEIKDSLYYFDGDTIKKEIFSTGYGEEKFQYVERELDIKTAENRTIVLPKTQRGKPKKLNFTATQSFNPYGVYFTYSSRGIKIASYTTQKTFYSENFVTDKKIDIDNWLENWIKDSTKKDLVDLENFKTEKRIRQKYKEGDIFVFKISRRKYGFGKIVIDIVKRRKTEEFKENKNYGLKNLIGPALMVKIFHKISHNIDIDLDNLDQGLALPVQAMMDNVIFYNQYKIIGHRPVTYRDLNDALISMSPSISGIDSNIAYLQYGLIYKEMPLTDYKKYASELWDNKSYRAEGISFYPSFYNLEACIHAKSNLPFYDREGGSLNNPNNYEHKKAAFRVFGLNADLDYEGNLKLYLDSLSSKKK